MTNIMNACECDLLDAESYTKHNDNYKYNPFVRDVLSKLLFLIPVKTKGGPAVITAFRAIFHDDPKNIHGGPYGYEMIGQGISK